jgi:enoyl-CoA hydratase/carnithine racemase
VSDAEVRLDRDGPVATMVLCRPHVLNAQTPEMWAAIGDIARELPGDVRLLVVRGEGRAFSSGLDLRVAGEQFPVLARMGEADRGRLIAGFQEAFAFLRRTDLITVAAVRGPALGAGFQLALACDFRIATEDAQFAMPEVTLGLVPDLGGTKRLVELVGYARALELCATGRRVGAAEAERIGLANEVTAVDDLDRVLAGWVERLLAPPRSAVIEVKALLAAAAGRTFAEQAAAEREAQGRRLRDLAGLDD